MWAWGENPANSLAVSLLPCFSSLASTDKHLDVNYNIADILLHHYRNTTRRHSANTSSTDWLDSENLGKGWIFLVGKRKRSKAGSRTGRRECVIRENILRVTVPLVFISWQLNGTEPQHHQSGMGDRGYFNIFYSGGFIFKNVWQL